MELKLVRFLMKMVLRFEIRGIENIPTTGPLVIVINHIAFLDPVLVLGSFPRLAIPMAKVEVLQSRVWGWLLKTYGAIPVRRGEVDMNAVRSALRVLKQGEAVLLAPEGTRSPTYQMQPAKDGAVILALRGQAQIVPVAITGTHRVKAHWRKFRRPPIHCLVGKPFRLQSSWGNGRPSRSEISIMTEQVMYRLAAQLPPEFRGVYSNVEVATDSYLVLVDG
jgi:1-acyl-sn-glycerol-3-phosphate acyltransferase